MVSNKAKPPTSWDGGVGILEFAGGGVLELAPGIWALIFWGMDMAVVQTRHIEMYSIHGRFSSTEKDNAQNMFCHAAYFDFFRGLANISMNGLYMSKRGVAVSFDFHQGDLICSLVPLFFGAGWFILGQTMHLGSTFLASNLFKHQFLGLAASGISNH